MTAGSAAPHGSPRLGIVAIGRNEGRRLAACFDSLPTEQAPVVYVDSGSRDDSVEQARARGLVVVELDAHTPFTAARARNAGVDALLCQHPHLEYVQFIDADCRVMPGWMERGCAWLDAHAEVAVVCGRRRELHPERSVYNRLADLEWAAPLGEVVTCGGDSIMRVPIFLQAGGFDPTLIAGEEPDLCLRMRRLGWRIVRLDEPMTAHDADLTRFSQWWRRAQRWGHGYTEMVVRHGRRSEMRWLRALFSSVAWALVLPAVAFGAAWSTSGISLWLLAAYPAQIARTGFLRWRAGENLSNASLLGVACCLSKFAELQGVIGFAIRAIAGRHATLIEYKGA